MDVDKLYKKCRLCLYENGCLNPIFETRPDSETKRCVKISLCTYLKVEPDDGLPNVVCNACLSFVENWYHFKLKCEQINEELLRQQQVEGVHNKNNLNVEKPDIKIHSVRSLRSSSTANIGNLTLEQLAEIHIPIHRHEAEVAEESDDSLEGDDDDDDDEEHIQEEQNDDNGVAVVNCAEEVEVLEHTNDVEEVASESDVEELNVNDDDDIEILYDVINVEDNSVPESVRTASRNIDNITTGDISGSGITGSNKRKERKGKLTNGPKTRKLRNKKNNFNKNQKSKYMCNGCLNQSEDRNDHVCFDNNSIYCDICNKNFMDRHEHEIHHANKMHKVVKTKCVECGEFLSSRRELSLHKRNKHKRKKKNFTCINCGKKFLLKVALNAHLKTHKVVNVMSTHQETNPLEKLVKEMVSKAIFADSLRDTESVKNTKSVQNSGKLSRRQRHLGRQRKIRQEVFELSRRLCIKEQAGVSRPLSNIVPIEQHVIPANQVQPDLLKKAENLSPEVEILAVNQSPNSSVPEATVEIESSSGDETDNSGNEVRVINRKARRINAARRRQQQQEAATPMVAGRTKLNVWCTCSICGDELKMKSVKNHLKTHGIKYGYYCIVCKQSARTLAGLETHLALHFSSKKHFCFQCFQLFNGPNQLSKHKETHGKVLKYVCPVCRQTFKKKSLMVRHAESHIVALK